MLTKWQRFGKNVCMQPGKNFGQRFNAYNIKSIWCYTIGTSKTKKIFQTLSKKKKAFSSKSKVFSGCFGPS